MATTRALISRRAADLHQGGQIDTQESGQPVGYVTQLFANPISRIKIVTNYLLNAPLMTPLCKHLAAEDRQP